MPAWKSAGSLLLGVAHVFDHLVDQVVVESFLGGHEIVTIGIFFDLVERIGTGVFNEYFV